MTKPLNRRHLVKTLVAPLALAVLAGCATTGGPVSADDDKAALLKRAQAYWALVRANDRVGAWAYEELSKDPNGSLEGYLKRGGITFEQLEVRDVRSLDGDRAVVNVFMRYSLPLLRAKNMEAVAEDEWRRINGVWHHVLRRSVMFPTSKE